MTALNPFQRWMVAQNVGAARTEGHVTVVARLHGGGYHRVAAEVDHALTTGKDSQ